jgi:hypothetical protein
MPAPILRVAAQVAVGLLAGGVVYLSCLWLMRAPELGSVRAIMSGRAGRTDETASVG